MFCQLPWFVYILQCKDGGLYTGITTDIDRRFNEHKEGKGSKYVAARGAKKVVWTHKCLGRSEASKLESRIKKLTRLDKIRLINGEIKVGEIFNEKG